MSPFESGDTVSEYLEQCSSVFKERTSKLPKRYIRLDVPHVTKTICRSKLFETIVKNVYLRCFGSQILTWLIKLLKTF